MAQTIAERNRKYLAKPEKRELRRLNQKRRREALHFLVSVAKARPCMDCGVSLPAVCMDFDHRPGTDKVNGVSQMPWHSVRPSVVFAEIAKCDLVCANCHRIRTEDRRAGLSTVSHSHIIH